MKAHFLKIFELNTIFGAGVGAFFTWLYGKK